MVKHWSRKLWLGALCAVLCLTLTAAGEEFHNETQKTNNEESNQDSQSQPQGPSDNQDTKDEDNQKETDSQDAEASTHGYTDRDCLHHKSNATNEKHVYEKCTLVCDGDEVTAVPDREPCWLNSTTVPEEAPQSAPQELPQPVERNQEESVEGICASGSCVAKKK
uniref:Mucin n=1 Tax=Rhipicephalus zambeziensis TaxID=60191 RepID=A0A224YP61_9ACAR